MSEMRILTVRQPWAWAIIHGGKDVENRVRNIAGNFRGPVAIHAAASATATLTDADERLLLDHDVDGKVDGWMGGEPIESGVILGVVDLVDVHQLDSAACYDDSEWAQDGAYHLVLESPRTLTDPIPYRGALGLRRLDPDTITLITAALAAEGRTKR